MNREVSILWRSGDGRGHEYARLGRRGAWWLLSGVSLFVHEGRPGRLDYSVTCDASWVTVSADVSGSIGVHEVSAKIAAAGSGAWSLNGRACPEVRGCLDVDLNFSPSTNLLPIRRLDLAVGERAEVRAAWLRFPSFTLEPLVQTYTRVAERAYRYESGSFTADLKVDENGFAVAYADLWMAESDG